MIAAHVIFSAYGMWLPNDPRGSWSDFVGSWELFRAGRQATKTTETRSLAYVPHSHSARQATKLALKRPPVVFNGLQARAVGEGFAEYVDKSGLVVWACAIMTDHVHLIVKPFRIKIPQLVIQLKGAATRRLLTTGLQPFQNEREEQGDVPKAFARGEWKVFLDTIADVRRAIPYVEDNPLKEGKPRQRWSFVVPFDCR